MSDEKRKKDKLRSELFNKYFLVKDGILAATLVTEIDFIRKKWIELYNLLIRHNQRIYGEHPEAIKKINFKRREYLIVKIKFWDYLIIDTISHIVIDDKTAKVIFDEDFFITNFLEPTISVREKTSDALEYYHFYGYKGDLVELIDFYEENKDIFALPTEIHYQINLGDAYTYFNIKLNEESAMVGFQTPNQFLYEFLWLNGDLSPAALQDATSKIGKSEMILMFDAIKTIQIPYDAIPMDILRTINHTPGEKKMKFEQ